MRKITGHEELRAQYVAAYGQEAGTVFHVLYSELLYLRTKWDEYVELFGHSPARVDTTGPASPAR